MIKDGRAVLCANAGATKNRNCNSTPDSAVDDPRIFRFIFRFFIMQSNQRDIPKLLQNYNKSITAEIGCADEFVWNFKKTNW